VFADLEAIEPVARMPSVVFDPRREFWLSYQVRQGSSAQKRRAVSARLPGFIAGSTWGVALLGKRAADLLAGIAHAVRLSVAGGVVAVFADGGSLKQTRFRNWANSHAWVSVKTTVISTSFI